MKPRPTLPRHSLAWAALWLFWVVASRHNHPTSRLNAIASLLLVLTFAAAVYANHLCLIPKFWRRRQYLAYGASLLLVMALLALTCTAAIHIVYDWLWGPDSARFGFWTNLGLESALVAIHVVAVAGGVAVYGRLRRSKVAA